MSAVLFIVSLFVGPPSVQEDAKLYTFILFPTWLKLLPILGSLIMLVSGYVMMTAEKQAPNTLRASENGGEQAESLKP